MTRVVGKRRTKEPWADHVEHPRFGRGPRRTGIDVDPNATVRPGQPFAKLHWINRDCAVSGTAVVADPSRQVITTMGVTHYYDLRRVCRDCKRPFLFFAAEQKHWYEELGFTLEADAVRCVPCRREQQGVDHSRRRYEALVSAERSLEEDAELAEHCLVLMESGLFSPRKGEFARYLAKRLCAKVARRLLRRLDAFDGSES